MTAHRRDFIRLVGGGAVFAALPMAGCVRLSDTRGAWRDPGAGERDPRRRALAFAILAPNPHNMQPWMADLRTPGAIDLHIDQTRLLPASDPFNRQIVIGCGAFLELLRMAAARDGWAARETVFPEGEPEPRLDGRPFARVTFARGGAPDPLFAHVLARRTSRIAFDSAPVAPAEAQRLIDAAGPDVASGCTVEPALTGRLKAIAFESARIEAHTPHAQRESCQRTFIGGKDIAAHRYGVSVDGVGVELAHAAGLLTQEKMAAPGTWAFNQSLAFLKGLAETSAGFVWLTTAGNSRARQIAAGRAYLRINTQAAALGLAMHPWSQALQEYPRMVPAFAALHRLLAPDGKRIQMFARIGHAKPVQPAPRRGLAAQILAA